MNSRLNNNVNPLNILATLNNNVIEEASQKAEMHAMGISACQVACMSYKCCTANGRGGKCIQHSYKI